MKKAVEAASSARPLPYFEYVPTMGCQPSHRHNPVMSHHHSERLREAPHANSDRQTRRQNQDCSIGFNAHHSHRPSYGGPARSTTTSTPYATHSRITAWSEELERTSRPQGEASQRRRAPEHRSNRERTRRSKMQKNPMPALHHWNGKGPHSTPSPPLCRPLAWRHLLDRRA